MTTLCDIINDCTECPRYGNDCDGDKRVEHTDLISRADAIEAVQTYLNILINSRRHGDDFTFINVLTEIRNKISALPSAETTGALDDAIAKYVADGLMELPSADTVSREFYEDAVKANIGLVIENRELKEQIESSDAVQGEWHRRIVDNGYNADWVCSECGYRASYNHYNYCPSCGARMENKK